MTVIDIIIKKASELDALPVLMPDTIVIVADAAGKLYKTSVGVIQQVLPVTKNADFAIVVKAGQMLEYICLYNANPMEILIGTTPGGEDIESLVGSDSILDGQPISLMRYAATDETIYITGILPATITKIKIS